MALSEAGRPQRRRCMQEDQAETRSSRTETLLRTVRKMAAGEGVAVADSTEVGSLSWAIGGAAEYLQSL